MRSARFSSAARSSPATPRHSVGNAIPRAQRADRRTGAAAHRRKTIPHRGADAAQHQIVPVRSTGASEAIQRLAPVVTALQQAGFVVDCTVEGLMHAAETPEILKAGARILVIQRTSRSAGTSAAGFRVGKTRPRGGQDAARYEAHARDVKGGYRSRRRHDRRVYRGRVGLD